MAQKQFLLCCLALLCCLNASAQRKIALEHNGNSSFFTDIPAAVTAAVSGDTIYLPGGSFPGFNIDKKLIIVGVGHNPDSTIGTTMTLISGTLTMTTANCDGSVFTGLRVDGNFTSLNADNDDIQVFRCFIAGEINCGSGSENWVISECFFTAINPVNNSLVSNNFIGNHIFNAVNCQIENNIFLRANYEYFYNIPISGGPCTVKNNIFNQFVYQNGGPTIFNSLFYNNIWSSGVSPNGILSNGNIGSGNINDPNFDGLFVNYSTSNSFYTNDFHLLNAAYSTSGTNGMPIGIYGGGFPWKAGSVPFNPHINLNVVAPATNDSGNLPVQIRVRAQNN